MRSDAAINQATIAELKQGYGFSGSTKKFTCLCCGFHTEPGRIYPMGDNLYDAEGAMRTHIQQNHQSALTILLELDKRWTGLTELQTRLIRLFASGISDQEIAAAVDAGSVSTIRNHRFLLRERQKQAKVFLAIAELMEEQAAQPALSAKSRPGNPADDEAQKILSRYFPQGVSGSLATFPTREKRRLILLKEIANRFSPERRYSEQEVNAILGAVYADHVLLRRLLIDYGLLARRPDGGEYWRVAGTPATEAATDPAGPANDEEESEMDERRKELIRQYKETPQPMGVFQIKNNRNGKLLLLKALNIPGIITRHQLELRRGMHRNHELQAEWNQYGEEVFSFEPLATIKPEEFPPEQWSAAVAELLQTWLEKLQPYGDAGYNKNSLPTKEPTK